MTDVDVSATSSAAALERMRATVPLVQCITNTVVQQFSANALLAAGASPAMLDHEADSAQFASLASGVLVNFGTATNHQLLAADAAVQTAGALGTPWVLDPVSLGAADHRSMHIRRLAASGPTAIRGNASEIAGLAGAGAGGRGIESIDTVDDVLEPAAVLAARTGAIVAVSGPVDAVVAVRGARAVVARVHGGHRLMPLVVGTGCSLGALTAAYLGGADSEARFAAIVAAHAHFAAAGEAAGDRAHGPGTFQPAFLDALHTTGPHDLAAVDVRLSELPLPPDAQPPEDTRRPRSAGLSEAHVERNPS